MHFLYDLLPISLLVLAFTESIIALQVIIEIIEFYIRDLGKVHTLRKPHLLCGRFQVFFSAGVHVE